MTIYVLQDDKFTEQNLSFPEISKYFNENGLIARQVDFAFCANDMNWVRSYHDTLYVVAQSLKDIRSFVIESLCHSHEFDGDDGVIIYNMAPLQEDAFNE